MAIEFEDGLPEYDSSEFQSYIKRFSSTSDKPKNLLGQHGYSAGKTALPKPTDTGQRSSYASFGDKGTTATVNAYGEIMRLSRYVGGNKSPSKICGLEFGGGQKPYFITYRAQRLQEELSLPHSGFGLRIANEESLETASPALEFVNDRWPRITYSTQNFKVEVRLFCRDGTILQQYIATNILDTAADLQFELWIDFLMHDMDYMNDDLEDALWEFMNKTKNIENRFELGPHDHSIVVFEKSINKDNNNGNQEQLGVVMGLSRNDETQNLAVSRDTLSHQRYMPIKYNIMASETMEITAAFKLRYLKRKSSWKDFILPTSCITMESMLQNPAADLHAWPFPNDPALSWRLRRNLEHILSVCSIPLKQEVDARSDTTLETEEGFEDCPIALTCGDFGDHRVSVSGSFFAFQYLLMMYGQLGNRSKEDWAARSLRARIHETCKGHLRWVFGLNAARADSHAPGIGNDASEVRIDAQARASNFWVDGTVIVQVSDNSTELPSDSPTNMPLQILKVTEYLKVFMSQEDFDLVSLPLSELVRSWVKVLASTKNHLTTTWQHLPDSADITTYRLSDHVWIWRALQSIERLIKDLEALNSSSLNTSTKTLLTLRDCFFNGQRKGDGDSERLSFTVEELRRQVLKRFTLENEVNKKRMLSVTRSARETRFLFHSRDTVLYYGMDWGFFEDDSQSTSELWLWLAESQALHDEGNDEMLWDNPLRYALAGLMGVKGHQLDRNHSAPHMITYARQILLNCSSANGLFPGQIDETTKEPTVFDGELYRDFYFYVGFEIPSVLLSLESNGHHHTNKNGRPDSKVGNKASEGGKKSKKKDRSARSSRSPIRELQHKSQPTRRTSYAPPAPFLSTMNHVYSYPEKVGSSEATAVIDTGRNIQPDARALRIIPFKRHIPYGKFVDLSNIVEIPEEWLYDYPKFLNFKPPELQIPAVVSEQVDRDTIVGKCIAELTNEISDKVKPWNEKILQEVTTIDVGKGKKQRKKGFDGLTTIAHIDQTYYTFWTYLRKERIPEKAKKRLVYLGPGDEVAAAVCYLASPDGEREHISHFFDRHANSREFLLDDTVVFSNLWETELHCSFYQLVRDENEAKTPDLPSLRSMKSMRCSHLRAESGLCQISEAAIGFRIIGDFFDRYWTCHIIENFSGCRNQNLARVLYFDHEHWQQRKVLELILFERILSKVRASTNDIIDAIKRGAPEKSSGEQNDLFDNIRFGDRSIESLQEILQILVILKNNFTSVLEMIDLWENRESTRGQGRPRWTRNDEQKYRQSIRRRLAIQERCIRDLRNQQTKIEFYIELVTSAQESIRAARSLYEAQNIKLFTYLTAFFLPVGLASSLFGMGQVPERHVVITMVITAAVALSVTALVLYCILSSDVRKKIQRIRGKHIDGKSQELDVNRLGAADLLHARTKIGALRQRLTRNKKATSEKESLGGGADLENGHA
ncbi:MAG: hypothetical protein Q9227_009214 [Pyrenula ochraceoflavens]